MKILGARGLGIVLFLAGVLNFPGVVRAQSQQAPGPENSDGAAPAPSPVPPPATAVDPATPPPTANSSNSSGSSSAATGASTDLQDGAKADSSGVVHHLAADISISLGSSWLEFDIGAMPPPTALAPYAPPFHLNALLALQNAKSNSVLQIATSTNPLIGRDSNWLDAQMHMPSGSGMSVLDLFFYYFFPPTRECIEQVLTQDPKATFAPLPDSASTPGAGGSSIDTSSSPVLQVSLACKAPATMMGFFQAQLSGGITFAQTNDGPRAFATIRKFYLAPMEHVNIGGMSWFIFEAQRVDAVGPNASTNYNLAANYQGAQSDYFWAIGAIAPFPFVNDGPRPNQPLIHVAYASVGINGNKHAEFMALLQRVQVRGANAGQ